MPTFFWIIISILFLGIAVVCLFKAKSAFTRDGVLNPARTDPLANDVVNGRFGPKQLGPGAAISYGGVDYVVRGTITLTEDGFTWWSHMLDGNQGTTWFEVEYDEGELILTMWDRLRDLSSVWSDKSVVTVGNKAYHLNESGTARYKVEGTTGLNPAGGTCRYSDYSAADGSLLGMELWDTSSTGQRPGNWEYSLGRKVFPHEITTYQAPKNSHPQG